VAISPAKSLFFCLRPFWAVFEHGENSAEKKYFFHRGKTGEADSVHQTKPTTTSDSLQNLQSAMLKTAFFNINPIDLCVLDILKL